MSDSPGIKRRGKTTTGPDFESLRRDGIALVQALSAETWTDYNLHDPGVTILEQLCYALTDLIYRTDFAVEDFLTGPEGKIDYARQALHSPEQVFCSRPTTLTDYRKAMLDAVPDVENVWLRPVAAGNGLYYIEIRLRRPRLETHAPSADDIKQQILAVYHRWRNLGEDVADIVVPDAADCELVADIEIRRGRRPADILAEIYCRCLRYIAGDIQVYAFSEQAREGKTLEQIFRGPYTPHGLFRDEEFDGSAHAFRVAGFAEKRDEIVSRCFSIISAIEGVDHIKWLDVTLAEDASPGAVLRLRLPGEGHAGMGVRLYAHERLLPVALRDVEAVIGELEFRYHAARRGTPDIAGLYALPQGEHRDIGAYYSIQHHFPMAYGINRYGVPQSATPQDKARAAQLKAYLLLFEQVMANFLAQLADVRELFSPAHEAMQSYRYQVLHDDVVPNVEALYATPPVQALGDSLAGCDQHWARKSRVLDYLLALYGEKFAQKSLRHFNDYVSDVDMEAALLRNKQALLDAIVEVNRDRAGAFDYTRPAWNSDNVSGLQKRVGILLGMKYNHARSLTDVFIENGLELISDEQFAQIKAGTVELAYVDLGDIADRVNLAFQEIPCRPPSGRDNSVLFEDIIFLRNNLVSESILKGGVFLDRYRVGATGEGNDVQLVFKPGKDARWHYLASYASVQDAIVAANDLRHFLIHLNVESEGMHVVEHMLLRPLVAAEHAGLPLSDSDGDVYAFRVSVIFPAWTARCANPRFRHLAQETVRLNCPAHIVPKFHWLGFADMVEFELRYCHWLELKRQPPADIAELDEAAWQLLMFLLERRSRYD